MFLAGILYELLTYISWSKTSEMIQANSLQTKGRLVDQNGGKMERLK